MIELIIIMIIIITIIMIIKADIEYKCDSVITILLGTSRELTILFSISLYSIPTEVTRFK